MTRTVTTRIAARMLSSILFGASALVPASASPLARLGSASMHPRQPYPPQQYSQQSDPRPRPAPVERRPPPPYGQAPANQAPINQRQVPQQRPLPNNTYAEPGRLGPSHEHLSQWMQSHSNLPLEQQQHALDAEPGFRQLQPDVQQRMHQRLSQLNAMSPEQRQRTISRTEAMERLAPPQRQQVRSALADLGALPEDRRRFVARTFRSLRDMPDQQRQAYLNSPQFRGQFSDHERSTLNNLFNVAPYMPPPPARNAYPPPYVQPYPQGPR